MLMPYSRHLALICGSNSFHMYFSLGSWTATLREIVRSMYQYYDYNPDTYYKCLSPTAPLNSTLESSPSSDQTRFFTTRVSSEEMDLDDTGDEIDVGMPYETNNDAHESPNHSSRPLSLYPQTVVMPTQQQEDISEDDDNETISVCSDHELPTGNYFGYEMARGDSAQTSPISRRRQSDVSEVSSTPSPQPLNQQPQLLYCNPQLYSQLYPSLQTTPFLLHPNLLMKNSLIYSNQEETAKKMKSTLPNDSSHGKSTLAIPYALSRPLQLSSLNLQASSTLPISYQPLPSIKIPNEERTTMHTNHTQATRTTPMAVTVQPHEAKNKKSRNHGIYIYTTPSEPLKFMSLENKKKNSASGNGKRLPHPDKKMVAMAPVVPPIPPETVIKRESEYAIDKASRRDLNLKSRNISHQATLNTVTNKTGSRKNQGAGMKRRRELVFHWYHSPEHQPSSSPPSTKRMNTASSV